MNMMMHRAVEVKGNKVEFVNMVGGFMGKPYRFICATPDMARDFGKFAEGRDPKNKDLPVAITDEIRKQFTAFERKEAQPTS